MYNSQSLQLPSPYAADPVPRRLTPNPPISLPAGECRFIMLHPSVTNQRCPCQGFRLNRTIPAGSSCDCGHQACYHVNISHQENVVPFTSHAALLDKVHKLEGELKEERRSRKEDVRILREAMHPFYRYIEDFNRRFVDMDDKVEGMIDKQERTQERIIAIDDATMALDNRVIELEEEEGVPKRRRQSQEVSSIDQAVAKSEEIQKPLIDELSDSRNEANAKVTKHELERPFPSPSPPPSEDDYESSSIKPASDFASPLEFVKAPAPISHDLKLYDAPSPVDLISSLVSLPMKKQIAELDKTTVEVGNAGDLLAGKKRKRGLRRHDRLLSMAELSTSQSD